jgi:hypothetical protein
MPATTAALLLSVPMILLGLVSGYFQVRGYRILMARKLVPSDEYAYYRNRYRRRLVVAGILVLTGGLIAGTYLSGHESRTDKILEEKKLANAENRELPDSEKQELKNWGYFWIGIIGLVFLLLGLAVVDAWSTRAYWHKVYREIRDDHNSKLRRDLEVYRQQRDATRGGRFKSGGSPGD